MKKMKRYKTGQNAHYKTKIIKEQTNKTDQDSSKYMSLNFDQLTKNANKVIFVHIKGQQDVEPPQAFRADPLH